MLPLAFTLSPSTLSFWAIVPLFALATAALVHFRRLVRGTTLTAAWNWTCLALAALAALECVTQFADAAPAGVLAPLRFAVATLTYCPIMALLGAKRPQDRAWQLIVLSLWFILALPAAEVFFLRYGQEFVVRDLRAWFLWIPLIAELAVYAPTRYRWAALVALAGQMVLLGEHLPLLRWRPEAGGASWGFAGLCLAVLVAWMTWRLAPRTPRGWPLLWRDFRSAYGLLWPMQVAERFNAAAAAQSWPVRLAWHGLSNADGAETAEMPTVAGQHLQNLLRRLVSAAWIAERLPEPPVASAPSPPAAHAGRD